MGAPIDFVKEREIHEITELLRHSFWTPARLRSVRTGLVHCEYPQETDAQFLHPVARANHVGGYGASEIPSPA